MKLGLIISHMNRSQIHFASFRSVLLPFCGLVYLGCASVTRQVLSRMLNTGTQYFPADSIQTSRQPYLASQSASSRKPRVKEVKRSRLYSVRPWESVTPMQA